MKFQIFLRTILKIIITTFVFNHHLFAANTSMLPGGMWISADYLYWWTQNSPISIPLVTENNNPLALGLINEPGTHIIFGSGSSHDHFKFAGMYAGRLTLGTWIDKWHCYGIEASGFGLSEYRDSFIASSAAPLGSSVINIPFYSTQTASEDVFVFHLPNSVRIVDRIQPWGAQLNGLFRLPIRYNIVLIAGFRYLNITERLHINDAIYNHPSLAANSILNIKDQFQTKNDFYGLQIGTRSNFTYNRWIFDFTATIALGDNLRRLLISGQTNIDNKTIIQNTGLFAEPSNIGTFKNNQFAFVPELQAKIAYCFNNIVKPFVAYNFLYINNIIQPGKQLDRNINTSQNPLLGGTGVLVGPALPTHHFRNTSLWMQGFSVGIEITFC